VVDRAFLGKLADVEKNAGLVRKTVAITRREELLIDIIVQDPRTEYNHIAEFIRHAISKLIEEWVKKGFDKRLQEAYSTMRELRLHADQSRSRAELQEMMMQIEEDLDLSTKDGDWESVSSLLGFFDQMVGNAPRPVRKNIRYMLHRSPSIRRAVYGLLAAGAAWEAQARSWADWFEALEEE